ncbi:MAG: DUF4258 domain-containing protein [Burkholderiales bacterium]
MKIFYRTHAVRRMFERSITVDDVRGVIESGDTIVEYADDKPYPSRLILGNANGRAVHVMAAYNAREDETIVITVYEPDPRIWEPSFRRRKS